MARGEGGDASPSPPARLRLTHLEIEGFKAFRDRVVVGPLADFTCIVGPNGCGKSVIGEAIAFALGGSRKMLRSGSSLAELLNQELRLAGGRAAQVTLWLEAADYTASAAGGHSGGGGGGRKGAEAQQRLGVRRTLRGASTQTHVRRPGSDRWAAVSQEQLREELAPHGLHTAAVDRFVVTQSRHGCAVDVADPLRLVRHLEQLAGGQDYAPRIAEQERQLQSLAASIDGLQQQIGSLEAEREALAPHVQHCARVQALDARVAADRLQLLGDQQQHGEELLRRQEEQVGEAEAAAAASTERLRQLRGEEQRLQRQQEQLELRLQEASKAEQGAGKKAQRLSAAAAAGEVQLASAAASAESQRALVRKLERRLEQLLAEEAQHKQHVADAHVRLRGLQEEEQEAKRRLLASREAAGAAALVARDGDAAAAASRAVDARLAAAAAELAQLEGSAEGAAGKAARAAESAAAAQAQAQAAAEAAGCTAARLREAEQELRQAAAAAEASRQAVACEEQQWAHSLRRQQQSQQWLQQVQDRQQQQQQQPAPGGTGGSWAPLDAAVASLRQRLPSTFHGRLCNVAAVRADAAAASRAVDAALEGAGLGRLLVCSDRATAVAAVERVREQRAGVVHCRILQELPRGPAAARRGAGGPGAAAAARAGGPRPLLECVEVLPGVPGLQELLEDLLGGWLLVGDRQEAGGLLHLRRSLVTLAGEVFRADGEVVVGLPGPGGGAGGAASGPHSLPVGRPVAVPTPAPAAAQAPQAPGGAAAAAAEAAREEEQARQEAEQAATEAARALAGLEAAREEVLRLQRQLAAAERSAQRLRLQAQADARRDKHLQQQLAAAQHRRQLAGEGLEAARAAVAQAAAKQRELQAQAGPSRAVRRGGAASSATDAQGPRAEEQRHQQLAAAVAAAWEEADSEKQLQKKAGRRTAAVSSELAKARGVAPPLEPLQARQEDLRRQLDAARADLSAAQEAKRELQGALAPARRASAAAGKERGGAQRTSEESEAALREARAAQRSLQLQQQERAAALKQQQDRAAAAAAQLQLGAAGCTAGGAKGSPLKAWQQPATAGSALALSDEESGSSGSSSSSDGSSSSCGDSSDSDLELGARSPPRAVAPSAARPKGRAGARRRRPPPGDGGGAPRRSSAGGSLEQRGRALAAREEALRRAEAELAAARARVDARALGRELAALAEQSDAQARLAAAEAQHAAAASALDLLLDGRFGDLMAVLLPLNAQLDCAYRELSGGAGAGGSARLSFVQDRLLLFRQGVELHAQPGGSGRWRRFALLSGGQQALASLALSFALQALLPSPIFFFDEVDAALDTAAAGRVAAFVAARAGGGGGSCGGDLNAAACAGQVAAAGEAGAAAAAAAAGSAASLAGAARLGAQYLLVSHKAPVYERAGCLLGVYSAGPGSSAAVLASF